MTTGQACRIATSDPIEFRILRRRGIRPLADLSELDATYHEAFADCMHWALPDLRSGGIPPDFERSALR